MSRIQVFEPAMCCSTGVCGPSVDPALVRFAADMEWLKSQGVETERANLSQQPQAFATNELVRERLKQNGLKVLPLVLIDGQTAFEGAYPTREELAARLGLTVSYPDRIELEDELPLFQPAKNNNSCC